jgi:hypothetical protein
MRTDDEYRQILIYWEQGNDQSHIARLTGIPRGTVKDCIKRFGSLKQFNEDRLTKPKEPPTLVDLHEGTYAREIGEAYAYLSGIYLGDGYINKEPRTYKLRISLDTKYPNIIDMCIKAIETLLPFNKVGVVKTQYNCVEVACYNSYWPEFFPQHGSGEKHTRPIILEAWQHQIVNNYPLLLLRGFIHSDGSRSHNIVNGKDYPRYDFSNHLADIKRIYTDACDLLGVHWRFTTNGRNVAVARRADVAFLDQHIGPKS